MGTFETLFALNVNEHTEDKNNLTYLSWSWAWAEVKKLFPDASYTIWKNENHLPYVYDEKTGYMVFTSVTIGSMTYEMWLPVMDSHNKAMKAEPYQYKAKVWEKGQPIEIMRTCESATMFDINKSIMRCLVKNLAMFGLGLYIYSGEDLPDSVDADEKGKKEEPKKEEPKKTESPKTEPTANDAHVGKAHIATIKAEMRKKNLTDKTILSSYGIQTFEEMTMAQFMNCMERLKNTQVQK